MPYYLPQNQGFLSGLVGAATSFMDEQQRQKANAQQLALQKQQMDQAAAMAPLQQQLAQSQIKGEGLQQQATQEQIDAYKANRGIDPTTNKPFAPIPEEQRVVQGHVGANYKPTAQDYFGHYMRLSHDYYKAGRDTEGKNAADMEAIYGAQVTAEAQRAYDWGKTQYTTAHEDWRTRYTQAGEWDRAQFTAANQRYLADLRTKAERWLHDNPSAHQQWVEQNYNPQALFRQTQAQMKSNDD